MDESQARISRDEEDVPSVLPVELMTLIAKQLHAEKDLITLTRLSQASRSLYNLITPFVYETVWSDTSNLVKLFGLFVRGETQSYSDEATRALLKELTTETTHPVEWTKEHRLRWIFSHIKNIVYRPVSPNVDAIEAGRQLEGFADASIRGTVLPSLESLVIDTGRYDNEGSPYVSIRYHVPSAKPITQATSLSVFMYHIAPYLKPRYVCHNLRAHEYHRQELVDLRWLTVIQHDVAPEVSAPLCIGDPLTAIIDFAPDFNTVDERLNVVREGFTSFFSAVCRLRKVSITKPPTRGDLEDGADQDRERLGKGLDEMFDLANAAVQWYTDDADPVVGALEGAFAQVDAVGGAGNHDGHGEEGDGEKQGISWAFLEDDEVNCPACGREYNRM